MRGGLRVLVLAAALFPTLATEGSAQSQVVAPPGSLVSWPGSGVTRCEMDGVAWDAVPGGCWFPVDLLEERDALEVFRDRGGTRERAVIEIGPYPYPEQHITIADDSQVNLSPRDLERVRGEQRRVAALWRSSEPRKFTLPLASPLRDRGASGRFGSRRFFNGQPRSPHSGADYAASEGTDVLAVADGRVVLADDLFFSGRSVFVDHGDGLVTMYFHLSEMLVRPGDEVGRGLPIGRVGQTGRATGPHLHFGARWRGARVDPEQLLSPEKAVRIAD